jgi:UDP-glucose 4-epimerase
MKKQKILITGGCGFIGLHVTQRLYQLGHDITVVDRNARNLGIDIKVIEDDYLNFLSSGNTDYNTIVHLAAERIVPRSIAIPELYYTNNVIKMKGMLDIMVSSGIQNIIFSSTGNLYGRQGLHGPLNEDMLCDPQNPYASSKVAGEMMLKDYSVAYGIKHITFRYFNAVGADPACKFGYSESPTTIIPLLCNKLLKNKTLEIYGSDYPTKDGTCVRDYVHVEDLANAHEKALQYLEDSGSNTFNLGGGSDGISINELVNYATEITNIIPRIEYTERRIGDPAMLTANILKAAKYLGWSPQYNIKDAIKHVWDWENKIYERTK